MNEIPTYQLVAFALDFEGSLHLSTSTNHYGGVCFQPQVSIGNTSHALLLEFCRVVGFGRVTEQPSYDASRAPVHYWSLSASEIRHHIHNIEPYLALKRRQAQLLIEAIDWLNTRETPGQRVRRSQEHTAQLFAIREELQQLNQSPCYKTVLTDEQKLLIELRKRGVR